MKLYDLPGNPLPAHATCVAVETVDGLVLRGMLAPIAAPRGTVVIIGGRADFIERYFETSRDLQALGYSVAALDLRGQGGSQLSPGRSSRGFVASFEDYVRDLEAFMTQVVMEKCSGPYFLLAHSTGGNVALQSLAKHDLFDKYILTAPLIGLRFGSYVYAVVRLLTEITTPVLGRLPLPYRSRSKNANFIGNSFTHDYQRWQRDNQLMAQAPDLVISTASFGWLRSALRSFPRIKRIARKHMIKRPVLAVLAGQEKIVNNEAVHRLNRLGAAAMAIITIPGSGHEILFETDIIRAQFFAAFSAFTEPADSEKNNLPE